MGLRIGCGFDVHRFGGPGPLMLGTIALEHEAGLVGHSDGDVVAHAICDALLAAAGAADIGHHFPPGDPEWAGAPGARLLELTMAEVRRRGLEPVNAHAVVICEAPRIAPHGERMGAALSEHVGAPVSIHATTTEGLGFTGRGEGIAAQAVALVRESP
jgi:2-C-methyl-D-erythritol 2,4-cyclodiphosphate synthase